MVTIDVKNELNTFGFYLTYHPVSKYKENSPDLVIMDITMPKMDGISAVRAIREYDHNANIIMCSSIGYQEKVVDAITAGASDFIVKPYEADKVIKSIKAVMKL